jgi:hypothetical protein
MPSYTIAIHPDNSLLGSGKRQSFSKRWSEMLSDRGHAVKMVDAYSQNFFTQLGGCHAFMWWFQQMPGRGNWPKKLMLALDQAMDIPLFPNRQSVWHFDDKIAQNYLLQAAGIPTPRTWVFWRRHHAIDFCRAARYPLVLKLTAGIMSRNVKLLHNFSEAEHWVNRLFGPGVYSLEHPFNTASKRVRDALRLLRKGRAPRPARRTDLQSNYLLIQEYLPGNDFDTRVVVIGNRAFGFRRWNRPGDFRASGSGNIDRDPEQVKTDALRLAVHVARTLGTQSLAVDVMRRDDQPVVVEVSYYYERFGTAGCPGHWEMRGPDRLEWVEGQMSPEDAILIDFIALVESRFKNASSAAESRDNAHSNPTGNPDESVIGF